MNKLKVILAKLKEACKRNFAKKYVRNSILIVMVLLPFATFFGGVAIADVTKIPYKAPVRVEPTPKPTRTITFIEKIAVNETLHKNPTDQYVVFQEGNSLEFLAPNASVVTTIENNSDDYYYNVEVSPNKKYLAFIKMPWNRPNNAAPDYNLYIYNFSTKKKTTIHTLFYPDSSQLYWSPKNDYVIISNPSRISTYSIVNFTGSTGLSKSAFGSFINFVNDYEFLNYSEVNLLSSSGSYEPNATIGKRDIRKNFADFFIQSPASPLLVQDPNRKYFFNKIDRDNGFIYYTSDDSMDPYNSAKSKYFKMNLNGTGKTQIDKLPEFITNNDLTDKITKVLNGNFEEFPEPVVSKIFKDSKNPNLIVFECEPNAVADYSPSLYSIDMSNTSKGINKIEIKVSRIY